MKTVTLKDVAKKAGVGVGTASRVLNNQGSVSEDKRKKVLKAIQELKYKPDEIARSLKTKLTRNIGVILNDITNPFYADLLRGLETEASESEYSIVFIDSYLEQGQWMESVLNFYKSKVDGIIYIGSTVTDEIVDVCLHNDLPFVYASASIDVKKPLSIPIYSVDIDNEKAAYDATCALIDRGHKKIGIILGHQDDKNSTYGRYIGFEKAMKEHKLTINPNWIHYANFSFETGYESMKKILACSEHPSAVFAISDLMAIGAAKAILDCGLAIPDDISIMGFDGINNSLYFHPEISTVNQPRYEMGRLACEKMIKLLRQEVIEEHASILEHQVLIRKSIKKL